MLRPFRHTLRIKLANFGLPTIIIFHFSSIIDEIYDRPFAAHECLVFELDKLYNVLSTRFWFLVVKTLLAGAFTFFA